MTRMDPVVTVAAVQMAMVDDVAANVATAERLVRDAASRGAQIVLIPELFEGPYFCRDERAECVERNHGECVVLPRHFRLVVDARELVQQRFYWPADASNND